jgi:hypothetical protein
MLVLVFSMPISALWLATYSDGSVRHTAKGHTDSRCSIPPLPFLRELLVELGGPDFDKQILSSLCFGKVLPHHQFFGVEQSAARVLLVVALVIIDSDG